MKYFLLVLIGLIYSCTEKDPVPSPISIIEKIKRVNQDHLLYDQSMKDSITSYFVKTSKKERIRVLQYLDFKSSFWYNSEANRVDRDTFAKILLEKIPKAGGPLLFFCNLLKTTKSFTARDFFNKMIKDTSDLFYHGRITSDIYNSYYKVVIPARKCDLAFDCLLYCDGVDSEKFYKSFIDEKTWEGSKIYKHNGSMTQGPWKITHDKVNQIRRCLIEEMIEKTTANSQ